jgi:hypothetical protein
MVRSLALALAVATVVAGDARADEPPAYEVRVPDAVDVAVDAPAAVSLTITPGNGRTISRDGPLRVWAASDTLELGRKRYARAHAVDPAADAPRFELEVVARAGGDHALVIDVRFWLCAKKTCKPVRVKRSVTVRAAAPVVEAEAPAP